MNCRQAKELMSPLLDEELPSTQADVLHEHLAACPCCQADFEQLKDISAQLDEFSSSSRLPPPPNLWAAIEHELNTPQPRAFVGIVRKLVHRPLAMAASIALVAGLTALFTLLVDRSTGTAHASVIDYRILMDGVAADVNGAIQRFLKHYKAVPIDAAQAHEQAPKLSFDLPAELPGHCRLIQAYRVTFGKDPGIAATYDKNGEPIFVIFHALIIPPGTAPPCCEMGIVEGKSIEMGPWRLIHVMDGTTCHCVLSTLDTGSELDAIVEAVTPAIRGGAHHIHRQ